MKLHLGCGKVYKKGYINIDAFDPTVADEIMLATDLKFQDNSVERIEAYQLIEHLGYTHGLYALSEWFRVLEPKGLLIMETPDLEASFERYVKGDHELRKKLLTWIYGLEVPGLEHKFCFPFIVLEKLLRKVGFVDIKRENFEILPYEPVLRVICEKPRQVQPFQTIARFRKILNIEKIIDINNQLVVQDREKIIDFFTITLKKYLKRKREKVLDNMVVEGAIQSPFMTSLLLKECLNQKLVEKNEVEEHFKVLAKLDHWNFPNLLFHSLKKTSILPRKQKYIFKTIRNFGRLTVKKLLYSPDKERDAVAVSLSKLHVDIEDEEEIKFFSETEVQERADTLFLKGIKNFTLQQYKEAAKKIVESISLNRDNMLYYWNLARVLETEGDLPQALENYKNAKILLKSLRHKNKNKIRQTLTKDLTSCYSSLKGITAPSIAKKPISSLSPI